MTTVSREVAKAVRIAELVREHLPTVLTTLVAAGERDLASQLASRCGTTEFRELGDRAAIDNVRAAGIRSGYARTAAILRQRIRAELERRGIHAGSPEQFADALAAYLTREGGG